MGVFYVALVMLLAQAGLALGLGVLRDWARLDEATQSSTALAVGYNLTALALAASAGYVLDRFHLLYAAEGTVRGPGFVDVHVVMPTLWLMAAIALVVAALTVRGGTAARLAAHGMGRGRSGRGARRPAWRSFRGRSSRSTSSQTSSLASGPISSITSPSPDEHSASTAFPSAATTRPESLQMRDLADNQDTVRNIRLWDYRPLLRTFSQIQQIRLYYQFYDVDVDRYPLADGYRQTMLAARELTQELPERARTWVNHHLQYTHGFGFAMSLAAQEGEEGTPTLVVKDLPPVATRGAPVGNPAIYYGEHMPDYVIVPSSIPELDYPSGDDNVYASYRGAGGVSLGSLWSRLLFAFNLMDVNILLTDYITPDSRIQIRRSLQDRVHRIAPFLLLDRDPYMVTTPGGPLLDSGRLHHL